MSPVNNGVFLAAARWGGQNPAPESTGVTQQLPVGGTQRAWIWGRVRGEMRVSWRSEDRSHLFLGGTLGPNLWVASTAEAPLPLSPSICCPPRGQPGPVESVGAPGDTGLQVDKRWGCSARALPLARRRVEPAGLLCCSRPAALAAQGDTAPGRGCQGPSSLRGVQESPGGRHKGTDRNARERAAHAHAPLLNACLPWRRGPNEGPLEGIRGFPSKTMIVPMNK